MKTRILIITEADDVHAVAVATALERKGAEVTLWVSSDFPTRAEEAVSFGADGHMRVEIHGASFDLADPMFDTVWRRRPSYVLDRESLHPADRAFAEAECGVFRRSLYEVLAPNALWVNPPSAAARAGSKILQQKAAGKVGFQMPATLFTNSPPKIRAFLKSHQGVVYKPLSPAGWRDDVSNFLPYTALVAEESLVADEVLRQTPGIYQELVPKAYELRVTVIGRRALAAKVLSQQTEKGKLDWRRSYEELRFEATCLPSEIEDKCVALLNELGLVFGCFDLIVTPTGESVFLEVNEAGQFLFVERYCGLPLLDAFAAFLLQGRTDFAWCEDAVEVRYNDPEFRQQVEARAAELRSSHITRSEALFDEVEVG